MDDCIKILDAKCSDYSGDEDVFKNFDSVDRFGITSEQGIMIRISDKLNRAGHLLNNEAKVKDEKIEDTLLDLINYTHILLVKVRKDEKLKQEEKNEKES